MTKPTTSSASAPRLCPTCGTRVGAAATKCLVCGADLTLKGAGRARRGRPLGARMPHPVVLLLLLVLTAAVVVLAMAAAGRVKLPAIIARASSTPSSTPTVTEPATATPTPTATETQAPTDTPLPPIEYKVVTNDTCLKIAVEHDVSPESIIQLNNLDAKCTSLTVGQVLLIPQPTPTTTPFPTATLGAAVVTQAPRTTYTVHAGDTLQGIANFYGLTVQDLMEVNGISDPTTIRPGQVLVIPIERRVTPGPTPTATPPPPWPAPNQLLPADGQNLAGGEAAVLQWTSVGTLRPNEYYYVVVEDVTCDCARFDRQAVTETKYVVPDSMRPADGAGHIYRWTVTTVRQRPGTTARPEYDPAGATSPSRVFSWAAGGTPAP
jgi:LysM repeat protein